VKWRARYQILAKEGEQAQLGPSDMEAAKTEIRRLQRELANVEEEREILKKVLSIFSRKNG
jgi:transposase-like protein